MDFSYLNLPAPQLINKPKSEADLHQRLVSGDYFGEVKKDGALYQIVKDVNGEVFLFSRTISKKTGFYVNKIDNVPHIKEWAIDCLPNDSILLGEIYYPGLTSKDVTKVMGALPDKAIARQNNNPIHYYIHDILRWQGISFLSKSNIERYEILLDVPIYPYEELPWLEMTEAYTDNLPAILESVFAAGEEGMVFKKKDGLYLPGKRPTYNVKAKTEDTVDAFITGFVAPEKEYTGKEVEHWEYWKDGIPVTKSYYFNWHAGIVVSVYDQMGHAINIANVTSGMTDFLRKDMAEHPENYLGKVVEVQCMSVDKDALTLRHPRLVRIRNDKQAKECNLSSLK